MKPPAGAIRATGFPLACASGERRESDPRGRAIASGLVLRGGCAIPCAHAVLLFERLGWEDAPLHLTRLFACLICVASGRVRAKRHAGDVAGLRIVAWVAVALAGGWPLLFPGIIVWVVLDSP